MQKMQALILAITLVMASCSRTRLKQDTITEDYFFSPDPVVGKVTEIYKNICGETLQDDTKIQIQFPPANQMFIDDLGSAAIPMAEESTLEAIITYNGEDYPGTIESYAVDGSDNQLVVFTFFNPPVSSDCFRLTFSNLRLPYSMAEQAVTIDFLDDQDSQYNQVDGVIKAFFAHKFGNDTMIAQSDTTVTISIQIPMALPAEVYFRLIRYGEYSQSAKTVTCVENCGSSPSASLSEQYYTIQVNDLVDVDIAEDTIITFTIDDISVPSSLERSLYYYQIGYGGETILEGGGQNNIQEEAVKLENLNLVCYECNWFMGECVYEGEVGFWAKVGNSFAPNATLCEIWGDFDTNFIKSNDQIAIRFGTAWDITERTTPFAYQPINDEHRNYTLDEGFYIETPISVDIQANYVVLTAFKSTQFTYAYDDVQEAMTSRFAVKFGFLDHPHFLEMFYTLFEKAVINILDTDGNIVALAKIKP